ncbi:MAG: hypothetical protein AABX24_00240 [Nanoarchaeota archaeon]
MPYYASGSHGRGRGQGDNPSLGQLSEESLDLEALSKNAEFGKLIPVEHAEVLIKSIHSDVGEFVLQAYNQNVYPDNKIAIRHYNKLLPRDQIYIIGKSRMDKRIEVTIQGGYAFGPYQKWTSLEIHLKYDGEDVGFQPEAIDSEGDIPLKREYGVTIRVNEHSERSEEPFIRDKRLNELIDRLYQIQTINGKKYLGLERGRSLGDDFSLEQLSEEVQKITGLAEAIGNTKIPGYYCCGWASKESVVDLRLFPEKDMGIYIVFRYCHDDEFPHIIKEWDEVRVGAVRKGRNYEKTVKDYTLDTFLQEMNIRKVQVTNEDIIVDLIDGRGNRYYDLQLREESNKA